MAEAKVEKLPFFISDAEKKGLEAAPQDNLADNLKEAIPDFFDVEKGEVVGSFGLKDGLLIFHLFKKDRKKIYDEAHTAMEQYAKECREPQRTEMQQRVAQQANKDLAAHPWWPGFEEILRAVFAEHFKYTEQKITYYPEVDSWSVIMPEPKSVAMPKSHLEAAVAKVALRVAG